MDTKNFTSSINTFSFRPNTYETKQGYNKRKKKQGQKSRCILYTSLKLKKYQAKKKENKTSTLSMNNRMSNIGAFF